MEKLLAIVSIAQKSYGRWLFQKLLTNIITIIGLIIVTAIMTSAFLIGILILTYGVLLQYGIGLHLTVCIVSVLFIVMIAMLIVAVLLCLRHLRKTPIGLLGQSNSPSMAMGLVDSFLDGLMKDQNKL